MNVAVALGARDDKTIEGSRESLEWVTAEGFVAAVVATGDPGLPPGARALLLTGGGDVDPALYGEANLLAERVDPARDHLELGLVREALRLGLPILGICRGAQVLAVALGGTLVQDLPTRREVTGEPVVHRGDSGRDTDHDVTVLEGSRLVRVLGSTRVRVNSHHHQAVRSLPPPARIVARSDDGVVEAFEDPGAVFVIGVQWHPERWPHPSSDALRHAFLRAARAASTLPTPSL